MTITKLCTMCGVEKPISEFFRRTRSKDGHQVWCKQCTKKENAKWYIKNKDYADDKNRKWARENVEHRKEYSKEYREKHKEEIRLKAHDRYCKDLEESRRKNRESAKRNRASRKKYVAEHREKIREWNRISQERHKDKIKEYHKKYRAENRDKINAKKMERLKNDPLLARAERLRLALREGINTAKNGGRSNKKSLLKQVTTLYSNELWDYLRDTWERRYNSKWNGEPYHIDHIVPICVAKTVQEVDALFHYSNLQMLTPEDNFKKKKEDLKLKNTEAL